MQNQSSDRPPIPSNPLGCLPMMLFVGLFIWFVSANVRDSRPPSKEETVILQGPQIPDFVPRRAPYVPFAVDEESLDQMMWLDNGSPIHIKRRTDSIKGFKELMEAGKAFMIGDDKEPPSTIRVKVLETKAWNPGGLVVAPPHKVKITITSGSHEGKTGWVSSLWIAK